MLNSVNASCIDPNTRMLVTIKITDNEAKTLVGLAIFGTAACVYGAYKIGKHVVEKVTADKNEK